MSRFKGVDDVIVDDNDCKSNKDKSSIFLTLFDHEAANNLSNELFLLLFEACFHTVFGLFD